MVSEKKIMKFLKQIQPYFLVLFPVCTLYLWERNVIRGICCV